MELLDEVRRKFSFLFDCGFSTIESGDWAIVLECGNLLLRITHDRADWFVDVGYAFFPDNWYEIWDVLSLLRSKGLLNQEFRPTNKEGSIRSALRGSIAQMMQIEIYKEDICSLNPS